MLKIFFAFVRKELYHILRDARTLAILIGMPIALVLIFGYTITNEFRDASVAIIDHSDDELSQALVQHLTASGHLKRVSSAQTISELEAEFRKNRVKMGIIIPPNFSRDFYSPSGTSIQFLSDATEPNYATTLNNYASQMIGRFQQIHRPDPTAKPPYAIKVSTRMIYNSSLVSAHSFIPGVVGLILMLICAMMTSLTIAKERETGTMDLLLVSPLPPLLIILGKITPYIFISLLNAAIVLLMGYYIFDVPVRGSLSLLMLSSLLYVMVTLALGVLISTVAKSQQMAMMISMFTLLMPTMLLSGFLFPVASMPLPLQIMSRIIPATYFIKIENSLMLRGSDWASIQHPFLILLLMFTVLITLAWANFKTVTK